MKNYDELTNDLLARRDCYLAEQKQKRITAVTSLCCVCFVALLCFGLWKSDVFRSAPPASISGSKPQIHIDPAPTTTHPSEQATTPTNDPIQISWTVNKVDSTLGTAMLNFHTPEYYSEKKNSSALTEYFGRDLSTLGNVMPEGFQYVKYEPTFFYKNDGTPVYDSCNFLYRKGEEQIAIRASKIGVPYDCLYMMDNPIPSNINGVELVIGGIYSDSGHLDLVFADFSHNGIQYRVEVKNMSFGESKDAPSWMVDILAELIK